MSGETLPTAAIQPEAELKEFYPRLKFETRLAQTWLVSLKIVFSFSRFEPALNWNRFGAVQRRGLNSLNLVWYCHEKTLLTYQRILVTIPFFPL